MPGPAPKPSKLKLLQGNPGHKKLNKAEPVFTGQPDCPSWITQTAKTEWKRIVKELESLDLLRAVDSSALASYCQAFARWRSAEEIVDAEGQTVQEPVMSKAGEVVGMKTKRHPATIIAKDERAAMHRAAALFGFDPSSRSRIVMPETPEKPIDDDLYSDLYVSNTR